MLMSVLLPAPFSPSRAWTSPARTSRSTAELARTPPGKRFVMPRSLTFMCRPSYAPDDGRGLLLGQRRDVYRPVDDRLAARVDERRHVRRHLRLPLVEVREGDAVVLEVGDVETGLEVALGQGLHRVVDGDVHVLHGTGE